MRIFVAARCCHDHRICRAPTIAAEDDPSRRTSQARSRKWRAAGELSIPTIVVLFWLVLVVLTVPGQAIARSVTDSAGRVVEVPDKIERVFAAGPPAAILLYMLAPEKMTGWPNVPKKEERPFIAKPYRDLPALGRLTGRGGTANLESC